MPPVCRSSNKSNYGCPQFPRVPLKIAGAKPNPAVFHMSKAPALYILETGAENLRLGQNLTISKKFIIFVPLQ